MTDCCLALSINQDFLAGLEKSLSLQKISLLKATCINEVYLHLNSSRDKFQAILIDISTPSLLLYEYFLQNMQLDERVKDYPLLYLQENQSDKNELEKFDLSFGEIFKNDIHSSQFQSRVQDLILSYIDFKESGYSSYLEHRLFHYKQTVVYWGDRDPQKIENILYLEGGLNVKVVDILEFKEFKEFLSRESNQLFIINEELSRKYEKEIKNELRKLESSIGLLILKESGKESRSSLSHLNKKITLCTLNQKFSGEEENLIVDEVLSLLKNLGIKDHDEYKVDEYCKVELLHFLRYSKRQSDVYIKLGDQKYVKVLNKYDHLTHELVTKYIKKSCEYFYVKKDDFVLFIEAFHEELMTHLQNHDLESFLKKQNVMAANKLVKDIITNIGPTFHSVEIAEKAIMATLDMILKDKGLKEGAIVLNDQSFFREKLFLLTSYIGVEMAYQLDWDNLSFAKKICMASFFMDITLEDDSMALITDLKKGDGLGSELYNKIANHPIHGANLVKGLKCYLPDVDKMILQHEEKPQGGGTPTGSTASQWPSLSRLFNLSHFFARSILIKGEGDQQFIKTFEEAGHIYEGPHFKKILKALDIMLK